MTDARALQIGAYALTAQNDSEGDAPVRALALQIGAYALATLVAQEVYSSQAGAYTLAAQEESSGLYHVQTYQVGAYALVKEALGRREMRAYTITIDDHDFYILNLGTARTLVFDCSTEQWSSWKSDGVTCWRPQDGISWEQDNVGVDFIEGLVWSIDLGEDLDDAVSGVTEDQVPIRSVIRGMHPLRLRESLGCYRAVLTVSQGAPAAEGVGIEMLTSDDMGGSWQSHGEVILDEPVNDYDVAWVSMGQIVAPGRIFEIIDTGYARRIEALDIDLGDEAENGG